jgi:hypothetical protein
MKRAIFIAALLAVPAAAQEMPGVALSMAAHYARYAADCADTVAVEQAQSFPIPVKTAKGLRYRLMYYPAVSRQVYAPSAMAQFDGDGSNVTCRVRVALPEVKYDAPLGPELSTRAAGMTYDAYAAQSAKLYAALERAAGAFAAGHRDAAARSDAADFHALFDELSEPALKTHYRALDPDFWAWLDSLLKK